MAGVDRLAMEAGPLHVFAEKSVNHSTTRARFALLLDTMGHNAGQRENKNLT